MKKVVFLLVIFLAVTGATIFAQSAEGIFAAIPAAAYTNSVDKATWTFSTSGLSIRDADGSINIPIREMRDLAAAMDGANVGCTFAFDTEENKRTYRIMLTRSGSLNLTVVKNGVTMPVATLTKN